jgi:hypothetical protein
VSAVPLPFALKLRDGAAAHFGLDGPSPASPPERPAPLRALFALERAESLSRPAVRRLTASRAFTALLEHAYCFDVEHAPMRELMVDAYLELSARVPSFELRFPSGFEGLPLTVEAVAGALRREAA